MNNQRRKELARAVTLLWEADEKLKAAAEILEYERGAEQEAYENMPESLQASERGERSLEAENALETAADDLTGFDIEYVIGNIEAACEQ